MKTKSEALKTWNRQVRKWAEDAARALTYIVNEADEGERQSLLARARALGILER